MGIFDKVNDAGKSISDSGNLKRKIQYEEERIMEIFTDIGIMYYKDYKGNFEKITSSCEDICVRKRRIKKMKMELYNLRGFKVCPSCGLQVNEKFQFCSACGTKLPDLEDEDFFNEEIDAVESFSALNSRLEANPSASV